MQLDRDINQDGKGKYALINLRKLPGGRIDTAADLAAAILANPESVEFGRVGDPDEFWVVKLKDKHAEEALRAYAVAASGDDIQYAAAVERLAGRAGPNSPFCKAPD